MRDNAAIRDNSVNGRFKSLYFVQLAAVRPRKSGAAARCLMLSEAPPETLARSSQPELL